MQLNFIQSNWLRQYPFRAGYGDVDLYNNHMPTDLIVSLNITCVVADLNVYINKVMTNAGTVSVSVAGNQGPLGYANGMVTTSNQNISIVNFKGGIIGNVTIGNIDSIQSVQSFIFDASNGLIEPSTILILPPPSVTSINVKNNSITGSITLTSSTLAIGTSSTLNLSVIYPPSITSRQDKSASYLTCDNPIISGINNVAPDQNGNIDIFAISPLVVDTVVIDGITHIRLSSPDLGLDKLCKLLNLPPIDATQVSHQPIETITTPEWTSWPQYNN